MLYSYPESLLDHATHGVIKPSSRRAAEDNRRLLAYARREARTLREQAGVEAVMLRDAAIEDGYRHGLLLALSSVTPLLVEVQQQQVAFAQGVAGRLLDAVRRSSLDSVAAPFHVQQVYTKALQAVDGGPAAVLHIPASAPWLLTALKDDPALQGLELRSADRLNLLLETGEQAWELDVAGAVCDDLTAAINTGLPELEGALEGLAARYRDRITEAISCMAHRQGLNQLEAIR